MVVRRAPLLLLLTACTSADAWTVFADTREPPDLTNVTTAMASAYRWSMRRPFMKWALSPDFCGAMHPLLIEEKSSTMFLTERWQNFTRCERIRNIIRESFDVWSAANPTLHFVDVTDRCESERLWVPIDDDKCAESQHCIDLENATTIDWKTDTTPLENMPNPPASLCSLRTCFSCPRADVIIGGFTQKNRRLGDQHAAARVTRGALTDMRPLAPSGGDALGKSSTRTPHTHTRMHSPLFFIFYSLLLARSLADARVPLLPLSRSLNPKQSPPPASILI